MTETALAVKDSAVTITKDDVKKYICPEATDKELFIFLNTCKSFNLNPMKREVHLIKYGNSPAQIVTGYEVYLKRAERTGKVNGWGVSVAEDGKSATVTIHRKDWSQPFTWTAYRAEFDKGQANWRTMPLFMLRKVAMAQAFRICFPDEMGGLPYLPEEISANNSESLPTHAVDTTAEPVKQLPADPPPPAPVTGVVNADTAPVTLDGLPDDTLSNILQDMMQTAYDTGGYESDVHALHAWTKYVSKTDGKERGYKDVSKLKGWQMKNAIKKAQSEGYIVAERFITPVQERQPGEDEVDETVFG